MRSGRKCSLENSGTHVKVALLGSILEGRFADFSICKLMHLEETAVPLKYLNGEFLEINATQSRRCATTAAGKAVSVDNQHYTATT